MKRSLSSAKTKHLEKLSAVNAGNLLSANADILQGAMYEEEMDEVMAVIDCHRETLVKTAQAHFDRPSRAGIVTFRAHDIPISDVLHLIPPGFVVQKDTTLHHRWKLEGQC